MARSIVLRVRDAATEYHRNLGTAPTVVYLGANEWGLAVKEASYHGVDIRTHQQNEMLGMRLLKVDTNNYLQVGNQGEKT